MTDVLEAGSNCWRVETAERFAVIIDAEQYFLAARAAMQSARTSIMLVGWDFDARIRLGHSPGDEGPSTLGSFMLWLVDRTPQLEIRLLQWNSGQVRNLARGTNAWHLLRWRMHKGITARMDSTHPPIASHHQKLLVVDDGLAFCGGIDMTMKRWDTREHADVQPERVSPLGSQLQPWHDMTSVFDGDAARAIGDLCRMRWERACGETLPPVATVKVPWPKTVRPLAAPVRIGIARSQPLMPDQQPIREIETLYLDMIARADRLIYAESQYFASRRVAAALARRLEEPDGPEVVIVCPSRCEGWLEPLAMDTARARLVASLRRHDPNRRFCVYHPVTLRENPIYVHAKLMIVDDLLLRLGSSNLNNRSMRLDTECDVMIDAAQDATGAMSSGIANLRHDLLAEHLGTDPATVAETFARTGSLQGCIEALRGPGRSLVPYEIADLSSLEAWLADNEIFDPDGPEEVFEPLRARGLFRGELRKPHD